jgi:hypothetical protein
MISKFIDREEEISLLEEEWEKGEDCGIFK